MGPSYHPLGVDKQMKLDSVMRELYYSEINCGMQSFWDGNFRVWVGDDMNGIKDQEEFGPDRLDDAAAWLLKAAVQAFPRSYLARNQSKVEDSLATLGR